MQPEFAQRTFIKIWNTDKENLIWAKVLNTLVLSTNELLRYMKYFLLFFGHFSWTLVVFSISYSRESLLLQGTAAVAVECCS